MSFFVTLLSLQNSSSFGAIVDGLSALLTIEVGLLFQPFRDLLEHAEALGLLECQCLL
jgi:hypothetical protein